MLLVKLLEGFSNHNQVSQELQQELSHIGFADIEFRDYINNNVPGLNRETKNKIIEKHNQSVRPLLENLQDAIRYLKTTFGV